MAYDEDPTETCCGPCGRWHAAPACDAWRWAPKPAAYRLADGSPCVERGLYTGKTRAEWRLHLEAAALRAVDRWWEEIEF